MREEMREGSGHDAIDRISDLLWAIGGQETAVNATIRMAKLKLEGLDPKKIIWDLVPEALELMEMIPNDTRDDAMQIIGFWLANNVMYKGFACSVITKIIEPLAKRIADLERTNETLNVALAIKEAPDHAD